MSEENLSTGKIGEIYFDPVNSRVRYFSNILHHNSESIDDAVSQAMKVRESKNATRIFLRFFVDRRTDYEGLVEARVPVTSEVDLLYIGHNHEERREAPEVLEEEDLIVEQVTSRKKSIIPQIPGNYEWGCLIEPKGRDVSQLLQLYNASFSSYITRLSEDVVASMIENSIVYVARDNGVIVSSTVGEVNNFDLGEVQISICQLSEMATKAEYQGSGLVTSLTKNLIRAHWNEIDMFYAGARAALGAINRTFFNLGFSYGGRFEKQSRISGIADVVEVGEFNNINLWYLNKEGNNESS